MHASGSPTQGARVRAWAPPVPGVREVLHARFAVHAYPSHTHAAWTLLILDEGVVRYGLGHGEHGALTSLVTLLPPHVPHDGRAATDRGFRKRVLYLDPAAIPERFIGACVDQPALHDPLLRSRVDQLHRVLEAGEDPLHAESRLALVADRLRAHLRGGPSERAGRRAGTTHAERLRELLDANVADGLALAEAGTRLGAHPAHLVRAFTQRFGIPPHRYLTGLRIDRARRLLLAGMPPARVAVACGFVDQSHLTRRFTALVGTTPARYAPTARG